MMKTSTMKSTKEEIKQKLMKLYSDSSDSGRNVLDFDMKYDLFSSDESIILKFSSNWFKPEKYNGFPSPGHQSIKRCRLGSVSEDGLSQKAKQESLLKAEKATQPLSLSLPLPPPLPLPLPLPISTPMPMPMPPPPPPPPSPSPSTNLVRDLELLGRTPYQIGVDGEKFRVVAATLQKCNSPFVRRTFHFTSNGIVEASENKEERERGSASVAPILKQIKNSNPQQKFVRIRRFRVVKKEDVAFDKYVLPQKIKITNGDKTRFLTVRIRSKAAGTEATASSAVGFTSGPGPGPGPGLASKSMALAAPYSMTVPVPVSASVAPTSGSRHHSVSAFGQRVPETKTGETVVENVANTEARDPEICFVKPEPSIPIVSSGGGGVGGVVGGDNVDDEEDNDDEDDDGDDDDDEDEDEDDNEKENEDENEDEDEDEDNDVANDGDRDRDRDENIRGNEKDAEVTKRREVAERSVEQFSCENCGKRFSTYLTLLTHLQTHQRQTCQFCPKRFLTAKMLRDHVRTQHQGEGVKSSGNGPEDRITTATSKFGRTRQVLNVAGLRSKYKML